MTLQSNRSSHVLITLGVLFTVCGAARLMPEGQAVAEEANTDTGAPTNLLASDVSEQKLPDVEHASEQGAEPHTESTFSAAEAEQVCFDGEMAAAMAEDRWLFQEREKALKEQKVSLQEWNSRLEARANELEALEAVLNERWQQMQAVSDSDIKHLAQMYGSMKPDQASQIFNQMDENFAAGFLRQLPSDQAGMILANMETEKAYIVSVRLASMNDDIRKAED